MFRASYQEDQDGTVINETTEIVGRDIHERRNVGVVARSIAILAKTIAEEKQRYCVWTCQIVIALLLTAIPAVISLILFLMSGGKPSPIIMDFTSTGSSYKLFDYKGLTSPSCCSPPAPNYGSYWWLSCPINDLNFAINYGSGVDTDLVGYIDPNNSTAGIMNYVPHTYNSVTYNDVCKMTPLFLNGVNGTSVIDNKFKSDNSLFSTYSGVFDFSKGSRKGRSIELDYALTAYTKTLFPTMVSSLLNATLYYGYYNFNLYNNMYVVNMSPSKLSVDGSGSMLSVITLLLIPIALSLMLPIFIDSFSLDRSSGLMEFISLYGVNAAEHAIVKSLFYFGIYVIYVCLQIVVGLAFQNDFFTKANPAIYIFSMLIWGLTLLGIANVTSLLKSASGYFIGYILIFFGMIGSFGFVVLNGSYIIPYYLLLIPSVSLFRILFLMMCPNLIVDIEGNFDEQVIIAFAFLIVVTFLLLIAVPVFDYLVLLFARIRKMIITKTMKSSSGVENAPIVGSVNKGYGVEDDRDKYPDDTVSRETNHVENSVDSFNNVIEIRHLTKRFGDKVAVRDLTCCIKQGTCFGLLGNNGAGKTTTVSCLLGLSFPYEGTCTVSGKEIQNMSRSVLSSKIGYVQQFDMFFNISVLDQLYFFARLKGIPRTSIKQHVESILEDVGLIEARRRACKDLSGGMQRRLSLAMAMLGDPDLLVLDEVSSGLDPLTADGIHIILKRYMNNKRRSLLLLSHSMEEVELLCDKIAIMVNGELKTIGTLHELKSRYGKGYRLSVQTTAANKNEQAKSFIMEKFRQLNKEVYLESVFSNKMEFRIALPERTNESNAQLLHQMFQVMSSQEAKHNFVKDWTCNQASLEEVFIKKVKWQYETALQ